MGEMPRLLIGSAVSLRDERLDLLIRLTPALLNLSRVPLRDRLAPREDDCSAAIFESSGGLRWSLIPSPFCVDAFALCDSAAFAVSEGNFSLNRSFRSEYRKTSFSEGESCGHPSKDMLFRLLNSFSNTAADGFE
jgi:hypothetical protein